MNELRSIPSVNSLIETPAISTLTHRYGRTLTTEAIRIVLSEVRQEYRGKSSSVTDDQLISRIETRISQWLTPSIVPVINATGVIIHTNLGRAPLCENALRAIENTASGYCNLEYSLDKGVRGSRSSHAEELLTRLTGAEAALVVNNNAAAILLVVTALASRKRVVISRTQIVEIGGGFRILDILKQSGSRLVEVGATNRVHIADYEDALQEPAAMLLRAHHSNYRITGFSSEPVIGDLVKIAREFSALVVDDLGSGALVNTERYGLSHEPTVQESLESGADLVCFSGDKLLGGPQSGIIVGRSELINKINRHPLARAVRADKLCLAALSETLMHYLRGDAEREVPVLQMISQTPEDIQSRVEKWMDALGFGHQLQGESTVGGGSLPEETLPTSLLALSTGQPDRVLSALRKLGPPIIARIQDDLVVLDPRTVLLHQEGQLLSGLKTLDKMRLF